MVKRPQSQGLYLSISQSVSRVSRKVFDGGGAPGVASACSPENPDNARKVPVRPVSFVSNQEESLN